MNIELTNGKKIIVRSKQQYEANIESFKNRGFIPVSEIKKEVKKSKLSDIVDKVVQLKPKKKKNVKKTKKKN